MIGHLRDHWVSNTAVYEYAHEIFPSGCLFRLPSCSSLAGVREHLCELAGNTQVLIVAFFFSQPIPTSTMESFTVAVIGRSAVGKSSFIQRVLGLPRPPISNTSSVGFVVDQVAHMVTLLEIDLASFELNSSQPISWPKQINGNIVPKVDASLILYNVVDQASIRGLSQMIGMRHKRDSFSPGWCRQVPCADPHASRPHEPWPPRGPRRLQV